MNSIDTIRLSERQKQQLIVLKRKTGIENWNVLCRWALCMSLADTTTPPNEDIPSDSNVEMSWKTLTGEWDLVYQCLLKQAEKQNKNHKSINELIKIHLSRGISLLILRW